MGSILEGVAKAVEGAERFAGDLPPMRRDEQNRLLCTAQRSDGQGPCRSPAMKGQRICRMHGGAAPQNKRAAKMRLSELVEPAIARLAEEMDMAEKPADRIKAANSILDRAGWGRIQKIETADAKDRLHARLAQMKEKAEKDRETLENESEADPEDAFTPVARPASDMDENTEDDFDFGRDIEDDEGEDDDDRDDWDD